MAAYKKDINLFKAAGGERAKGKKMEAGKKLMIVAVIVVIVLAGAIGGLYYYNSLKTKEFEKQEDLGKSYTNTLNNTKSLVAEKNAIDQQIRKAAYLEYKYMEKAGFSTDLSKAELTALHTLFGQETTGFSTDNHFDAVVDDVLLQLNRVQFAEDVYPDDRYDAKFLYGALSYMKAMKDVFVYLPMQSAPATADGVEEEESDETPYWYCYYRGKFVMLLRATTATVNATALAATMQTPAELGLGFSPFRTQGTSGTSTIDNDFSIYRAVTVGESNTGYVVMAVDCKTALERFLDCVEDVYAQQSVASNPTYDLKDIAFNAGTSIFSVYFTMTQSEEFRLKDVCDAVVASPFFEGKKDFAYEVNDSAGLVAHSLQFEVVNEASKAVKDMAEEFFAVVETEEEE